MQLTGDRFTSETAEFGNACRLARLPGGDPRPGRHLRGVSALQLHFADHDRPDRGRPAGRSGAMNRRVEGQPRRSASRGCLIVNDDEVTPRHLAQCGVRRQSAWTTSRGRPTGGIDPMTIADVKALEGLDRQRKDADGRRKMFRWDSCSWLYKPPRSRRRPFLDRKFAGTPDLAQPTGH